MIRSILLLGLLLGASSLAADEPAKPESKKVLSEGWAIPKGQEARFAEDERACLGPAMSPKGRRADPRKWESCMEKKGWHRK